MPSGRRSSDPMPVPSASGNAAEQRRHRRHHDRAEAQQARLVDRLLGRLALLALRLEREVDHHDRVLLHDADQQDDADQRDRRSRSLPVEHQREDRAHAGRRQRRENRERVDVALVEHAQHDVDRDDARPGSASLHSPARPGTPAPCPGTRPRMLGGSPMLARRLRWPAPPRPSDTPGARLNDSVTAGKLPLVVDRQRRRLGRSCAIVSQRRSGDPGGRSARRCRSERADSAEIAAAPPAPRGTGSAA